MTQYTIDIVDVKTTSAGKEYKSVTLKAGTETYEKVSIWSDNPDYDAVVEGGKISGEVFKNEKGYWNFKGATAPKTAYKGGAAGINKAMEVKAQNIEKAQDRKDDSIAISGAMRDATLISLAALRDRPFPTDEEYKAEWTRWVKWLLSKRNEPFL